MASLIGTPVPPKTITQLVRVPILVSNGDYSGTKRTEYVTRSQTVPNPAYDAWVKANDPHIPAKTIMQAQMVPQQFSVGDYSGNKRTEMVPGQVEVANPAYQQWFTTNFPDAPPAYTTQSQMVPKEFSVGDYSGNKRTEMVPGQVQ